jgi:hypothetical protein
MQVYLFICISKKCFVRWLKFILRRYEILTRTSRTKKVRKIHKSPYFLKPPLVAQNQTYILSLIIIQKIGLLIFQLEILEYFSLDTN